MLEDYVSKLAWALSKHRLLPTAPMSYTKHARSNVTTTESTTPVEQRHAFHKVEELKSAFLDAMHKVAYTCIVGSLPLAHDA